MADQSNIQSAASKSIRPFRSSEEYLYAMKEDLAEWLNTLYDLDIQVENFMDVLETGFDLCQHANNVNRTALEFQQSHPEVASSMRIPQKEVVFQAKNVVPGSFIARDNISNFIQWCRQELGIQDVLMFETNDLVLKKNEKNFVLCLLEVARKGSKFGMLAPMLIQMEEEIEEEMRDQIAYGAFETSEKASQDLGPKSPIYPNRTQRITLCDLKNLDELVREILGHCTCPSQFPMVKVSEGKYKVGDSNALIFVRGLFHIISLHSSSLKARRLSGDSDSSASSIQSGTLSRRRNEEATLAQRKEPGRRVSEGAILQVRASPKKQLDSRSQSRERVALPRPSPGTRRRNVEERGRARLANETSKLTVVQSPRPRAHSQGRPSGEPVLLISRGKDGQHSWARAEEPKENAGGSGRSTPRAKSPAVRAHLAPAGSRSPSLTNRRGSLPATKTADAPARVHMSTTPRQPQSAMTGVHGSSRQTGETWAAPSDSLGQELEQLARNFRTPLRLDPSQEQQLYRRLEEEFLANSQMMGLEEEEEEEEGPVESLGRLCDGPRLLQTPQDPGAADSAYCSSSSSSSSLNFFTKYGFQPDPKEESKRNTVTQRFWASETGPVLPVEFPNGSADPADLWERTTRWRKPALSSSSDESNCYMGLNDLQEDEFREGGKGTHLRALDWESPQVRGSQDLDTKQPPLEDHQGLMGAAVLCMARWLCKVVVQELMEFSMILKVYQSGIYYDPEDKPIRNFLLS
ncbi:hypothetical protein JD844_015046 [Phrynosoma platyrhinos]|uniref:GAS2-like protein 1 n=1 Tax=Phrynosoma platyrhinos TaxID=52577 RepID=A0ABQ7T7T3_PHRPL|nr:hypothetical protein JD844_015046 [Phrynosoma platyrhinos]